MNLTCQRCNAAFDGPTYVGYCPECVGWFKGGWKVAHAAANPAPGVHRVGKFQKADRCPHTVTNPFTEEQVCGLCGGDELDSGYGFAGGFGLGGYTFCGGCYAILDFSEDSGE
jgi:hypothetical protein